MLTIKVCTVNLLVMTLFVLTSCSTFKGGTSSIASVWRFVEIEHEQQAGEVSDIKREAIFNSIFQESVLELTNNHQYSFTLDGSVERGSWTKINDRLELTPKQAVEPNHTFTILQSPRGKLRLLLDVDGKAYVLVFAE